MLHPLLLLLPWIFLVEAKCDDLGVRILEGHLVTFRLKCDELWSFRVDSDDLGGSEFQGMR